MKYKEYTINGTEGYKTAIDVIDGTIFISDVKSYDAAFRIPLSQIDELINILQKIKQTENNDAG